MSESDLPQGTAGSSTPMSFDEGVDAISSLNLGSDDPKPVKQIEATNEADDEADAPEQGDEAELEADAEDVDDAESDEDGPEASGGKFVSNDAKVTLNDGTVTTVQELKRGFMSQQHFTRKTQEVAEERKLIESQKAEVGQYAQSLAQQRDFLLQAAQMFLPAAPDRSLMEHDPLGYMQAKEDYEQAMQVVNQILYQKQSETGRMTQEQQQAANNRKRQEAQKLLEAVPEFKDRTVYEQFWGDAVETMGQYGFSPDELNNADDHRMFKVMRDLVKYHKARKQAPKVQQELQGKPQIMSGGRRMDPKAKISRDAQNRTEQLRKTGSFEAGVAALMDLK